MQTFMNQDFLLSTPTAKELYHYVAAKQPIIDYHCHLDPAEIAEDKRYENITQIWLYGDHYKWRYMRSCGIEEKYCTGDASDYEKFLAYAKTIGYAIGNPLYHWTHLELQRYFGISEPLNEKSAPAIWEQANKQIASPDFSAKNLIRRSNVVIICTTDDPTSDLTHHEKIQQDKDFHTKVLPTFRPDNALNIQKETFPQYIKSLEQAAGKSIVSFRALKEALSDRLDYFQSHGCKLSDHSLAAPVFRPEKESKVEEIFQNALQGQLPSQEETEAYQTALLLFLGEEYAKRDFAMQLHLGAMRNNNTRQFQALGPDTGFDSIDDLSIAHNLSKYMDALEQHQLLPKTILYTLNPKDNYVLGSMLGNFQQAGIQSKIQFGSAWWFNDQIDGMTQQLKVLANLGSLSGFVGMLTDSRSFLSYPRHEYFRRILCRILGQWVEEGWFPKDMEILSDIVAKISYQNCLSYFHF